MKPPDKARMARKAVCPLVFSVAMLAGLPGTVAAQGFIDFCDPQSYDNAKSLGTGNEFQQSFGSFTDLYHYGWTPTNTATITYKPDLINVYRNLDTTNPLQDSTPKPKKCGLNFFGNSGLLSNGHAEMWITILGTPQLGVQWNQANPPPMSDCWGLKATVWFDNSALGGGWNNGKWIGMVTNFDASTKRGLFFGLYDAGNTEALGIFSFDALPTYPTNIWMPTSVASVALKPSSITSAGGGGTTYSLAYYLSLDICTGPDQSGNNRLDVTGSVQPSVTNYPRGTCPADNAPDQQCLSFHGPLPVGIVPRGAAGLAALAPTTGAGFIDAYVADFAFTGASLNPD